MSSRTAVVSFVSTFFPCIAVKLHSEEVDGSARRQVFGKVVEGVSKNILENIGRIVAYRYLHVKSINVYVHVSERETCYDETVMVQLSILKTINCDCSYA